MKLDRPLKVTNASLGCEINDSSASARTVISLGYASESSESISIAICPLTMARVCFPFTPSAVLGGLIQPKDHMSLDIQLNKDADYTVKADGPK